MKYVNINNKIWAVGLHWNLAPAISRKDFIKKVLDLDENFDLICHHKRHYGFGVSGTSNTHFANNQKLPISYSLAAYLRMPSLMAMFKLVDVDGVEFWWVVAIREHSIVGTGDQVFETKKDAEDAILNLNEFFDSDIADTVIIADIADSIDWLSPHLKLDYLDNILGRARITLIHEDVQKKRQKALIYAVTAIVLFIGSWNIWAYIVEQKVIKDQHTAYLKREEDKARLLAHPEKQFKQEWLTKPLAYDVAISCIRSMQNIPTNINGWSLSSLTCTNGKSLQLDWKHESGANFINLPLNSSLKTPQQAFSRLQIANAIPLRKKHDFTNLLNKNDLMSIFYQICQSTGTKLKTSIKAPQKKTIDKIEIISPWQKIEWSLSEIPAFLMSDNLEFAQILGKIPGLCLNSISYTDGRWTFSGTVNTLSSKKI